MMHYRKLFFVACLFASVKGFSQTGLYVPANIQTAYQRETRSADGKPGKNYWQNRANYTLAVNFNPTDRLLSGTADIQYFNDSPDTLRQIWFKLYPNLYKKGSIRMQKIAASDITDGVQISGIKINGDDSTLVQPVIEGTNMTVSIKPLLPKQSIIFSISYSYTLNKGSHIRTGEIEEGADFVAYFFPRIAVYDDIDGWNKNPYTGPQEFYNDFCHFFASVTVPPNYLVWGTGDLKNSREVLNEMYWERLQQAGKSDTLTVIIDSSDLQKGNITNPQHTTWEFEADNVTDFAFATSDHYVWQASSVLTDSLTRSRTRVDAVFNPRHSSFYHVAGYARKTVQAMSFDFPKWPFPYPHETVFDGLDQMEYPMMVNDNPLESKADDIELTDHEIFHTMFPFYMGINETKYGWMDEGWATLAEWLISPMIDSSVKDEFALADYETTAGTETDLPIVTLTTQMNDRAMLTNSYGKPALGYLFVKDLLGDQLFYKALHEYIAEWNGRHPMPYDFFNCINTASGHNLNWFWKRWFFENGVPNLAISDLLKRGKGKKEYAAVITSKGTKPVPVDLTVYVEGGAPIFLHRDMSCWEYGNKAISIPFTTDKVVRKLVLGSLYIPDTDKTDNVYEPK